MSYRFWVRILGTSISQLSPGTFRSFAKSQASIKGVRWKLSGGLILSDKCQNKTKLRKFWTRCGHLHLSHKTVHAKKLRFGVLTICRSHSEETSLPKKWFMISYRLPHHFAKLQAKSWWHPLDLVRSKDCSVDMSDVLTISPSRLWTQPHEAASVYRSQNSWDLPRSPASSPGEQHGSH